MRPGSAAPDCGGPGRIAWCDLCPLPPRLLARAIQHELDHLEGVLFIDRMSESARNLIAGELDDFELAFQHQRSTGEIPSDEEILKRLAEIEGRYC